MLKGNDFTPVWCASLVAAVVLSFQLGAEFQRRADQKSIDEATAQVRSMVDQMERAREELFQATREYRGFQQQVGLK